MGIINVSSQMESVRHFGRDKCSNGYRLSAQLPSAGGSRRSIDPWIVQRGRRPSTAAGGYPLALELEHSQNLLHLAFFSRARCVPWSSSWWSSERSHRKRLESGFRADNVPQHVRRELTSFSRTAGRRRSRACDGSHGFPERPIPAFSGGIGRPSSRRSGRVNLSIVRLST